MLNAVVLQSMSFNARDQRRSVCVMHICCDLRYSIKMTGGCAVKAFGNTIVAAKFCSLYVCCFPVMSHLCLTMLFLGTLLSVAAKSPTLYTIIQYNAMQGTYSHTEYTHHARNVHKLLSGSGGLHVQQAKKAWTARAFPKAPQPTSLAILYSIECPSAVQTRTRAW